MVKEKYATQMAIIIKGSFSIICFMVQVATITAKVMVNLNTMKVNGIKIRNRVMANKNILVELCIQVNSLTI